MQNQVWKNEKFYNCCEGLLGLLLLMSLMDVMGVVGVMGVAAVGLLSCQLNNQLKALRSRAGSLTVYRSGLRFGVESVAGGFGMRLQPTMAQWRL